MTAIHPSAILIFAAIVLSSLVITYWAHRRSKSVKGFYAAGGNITPMQNGIAISGDFLSAASFLGTIAVFYGMGDDGLIYAVGAAAGWPIVLCLVAERLRNLGRYTFSDVVSYRLEETPIRLFTAVSTLCVTGAYLIAQMVGGATLIAALFGLSYASAIACFGVLMVFYVVIGGMTATTWIQIIKATLLVLVALVMVALAVGFYGGPLPMIDAAAASSTGPTGHMRATGLLPDGFSAVSLALAFTLGPVGLPHILMRFFTVRDGISARRSLSIAALIIAVFQMLMVLLGYAAMALLSGDARFTRDDGTLVGGLNMATLHLAEALGGPPLLGAVSAASFATILAVVAGLTLAAASAVSHDLYRHVFARGTANDQREVRISKISAAVIGLISVLLGLAFEHQNIAFLATLPLVIAASVNCPILLLALYWKGLTTRGAVTGGTLGLLFSVVPIILSKKVWVDTLGRPEAIFPYEYPTVLALAAAIGGAVLVSHFDRSGRADRERAAFAAQRRRSIGLG
ncbi:cation/acetate symporter ActP [Sphingomonas histidinilytica]|uniref:sodium:solute symporter family transporter n=1 Tax=Rhizorhabdus histidinilytica TaxID=439228 RepID=UPI001AD9E88A|nr:cation acetate symporter [Rhizorhabdus histidinilytica]MBO9376545.1 cation/acetate symporter ActP [Rhizorhabdus histidinilytica]